MNPEDYKKIDPRLPEIIERMHQREREHEQFIKKMEEKNDKFLKRGERAAMFIAMLAYVFFAIAVVLNCE